MSADGGSLVATVRATVRTRGLVAPGTRVLVACSGGPDSVAMLDALHRLAPELGLALVVASVDHGLRPEARDEVAAVASLAASRRLGFVPIALALAPGATMERARAARYAALARAARYVDARAIAVGHTRDDQAETVLARLVRGAGLRGLRAIAPMRDDGVVRPLIDASRAQVEAHLAVHGLAAVSDPTNRDLRYQRVRIRTGLLPQLAEEEPTAARNLAALADEAAELAAYAEACVAPFVATMLPADALTAAALDAVPPPFRAHAIAALIEARTGREPGRRVIEAVRAALRDGGSVWVPGGYALEGREGVLAWRRAQRTDPLVRPKD